MAPYFLKPFTSLIGQVYASGGKGWGEHIHWVSLKEGQTRAASEKKPLMVIIHEHACPACKILQEGFSKSTQIHSLSQKFAMVNLKSGEDEIPLRPDFTPDGNYFPRIMFFSPDGTLLRNACHKNSKFKFFYESGSELATMMNSVVASGIKK